MTIGRFGQGNRPLTWMVLYGQDTSAAATSVIMGINGQPVLFTGAWNPGFPSACRITRVHVTAECFVDSNPGNWTLNFYKNEDFPVPSATFSFAVTSGAGPQKTAGPWSAEILMQPGETFWISATGPAKNTVIVRATLEFEVL